MDGDEFSEKQVYVGELKAITTCKNCENWNRELSSGKPSLGNYVCACDEWSNLEDAYTRYTRPDDYCSYAVKREDD